MKAQAFGSPIFVKRAAYVVQEIANLEDAIDFLDEWPEDRRDLIHETALKACCDAYGGHKPLSAARAAFYGFAVDCRLQDGQWQTVSVNSDS
ncbi:hypothetical protein MPL1032_220060 [Mesorhizobium plurifarium]|uniref:DUF982 domain-containing protein n=1 Tax=Mesorhizobium plurifarium TaxID=69974 RepID=A0A0K2VZI9_MESPL|nr:hypothetical protein MPL1032_220060 [Mesorhizobium plurifarium]